VGVDFILIFLLFVNLVRTGYFGSLNQRPTTDDETEKDGNVIDVAGREAGTSPLSNSFW
jgi:hypothetical protein